MLSSPQAQGLFHKAILQSGTALFHPPAVANGVADAILSDLAIAPHEAGRLRDVAATDLLEVQTRVTPRARWHRVSPGSGWKGDTGGPPCAYRRW